MVATLKRADKEQGYFMTDSSTWIAEKQKVPNLKVLLRGDRLLVNTYHTLCQPSGSTQGASIAAKFIDLLVSEKGQKIIREFGRERFGEGLYNDAAYSRKFED